MTDVTDKLSEGRRLKRVYYLLVFFFLYKQKTAYEMRISDWSSDVCSSDLELLASNAPDVASGHPDPNAVKLLLYTSGTTSHPKGVLHSHNSLMAELLAARDYWGLGASDVVLMPSPVTHITGYLYALEMGFVTGCAAV